MSETTQVSAQDPLSPEVVKAKEDNLHQVKLEISRPPEGSVLHIYIKAPLVAAVIRGMATGNYAKGEYADIYKPVLKEIPDKKDRVFTRPAITRATNKIVGGTDFSFAEPPRGILLANPDALEEGFTLVYKVDAPVPYDQLKKWGKQLMDGCQEIITNAKPFRMSWVMNKTD